MEKPAVLLVDDNEATCTLVRALLRHEFEVDVTYDGAGAIEQLRARHYAAVLLDLRMPQVDGYGVLDFLKSTRPELLPHVLVLTAALAPQDLDRVREYDVAGVIAKPFEIETLAASVRRAAGVDGPGPYRAPLLTGGMVLLILDRWLM